MSPQMYFALDNYSQLKSSLEKHCLNETLFIHEYHGIYYDNIVMLVSELEKIDEFINLHKFHKIIIILSI